MKALTSTKKRRRRTNKNVPAKGRLRDMADQLWSLAVREDWNHKCAVCGFTERLEAHHLIPRQWFSTRYDLRNGITLCARHHQFDPALSPHQNAAGWLQWLDQNHRSRADWYKTTIALGAYKKLLWTKNADYFCTIIRSLKEYVDESNYERIVGVRFSQWLLENVE